MGIKTIKAAKFDVLAFIKRREIITAADLMQEYGYTYKGALGRLYRLRNERLAEILDGNQWILTNDGYRRLSYYGI